MKTALLLLVGFCVICVLGVGPTDGSLSLNFRFSGVGHSQDHQIQWNITNNVGEIIIRNSPYQAVAYYTQVMGWPNPPGTVRWIDLFCVETTTSNLAIVYLGLAPTSLDSVIIVWEEDFTHTIADDGPGISSSLNFVDLSGKPNYNFSVSFPALVGLPPKGIDTGILIEGADIYLNRTHGWIDISGTNYTVTPISTVDCTDCGANCHSCLHSPWFELHFIYSSPSITGFGIYYIYPYNRTFVQLNYTLALPTLQTPAMTYAAKWTGTIPSNVDWSLRVPFITSSQEQRIY